MNKITFDGDTDTWHCITTWHWQYPVSY